MSGNCRSLLFLLHRCVAVRQVTLTAGIKTKCSVLSGRLLQQRSLTSAARRLCELQSTVKSSQHGFCTKAGAPCDDGEYPPYPDYQPDPRPEQKEVYIVHVKGLPWSCTAQDLLQFFSDCRICEGEKGIHLTSNWQGRPSGEAFVVLEHETDVSKALEKNRQFIGPRFVEVNSVTNSDAEEILKKAVQAEVESPVVRLRGLPFNCTEADISQFFSGLDIVPNGITFVKNYKGNPSGVAYVEFFTEEDVSKALQKDRHFIGTRYIEVFPSRRAEVHTEVKKRPGFPRNNSPRTFGGPSQSSVSNHYVHMRGLPFPVSGEDIVRFFSPLTVTKILIECGPKGIPSGEADVYFSCHEEAISAMSRDKMYIGERYIELFLNSAPDCDGR